MCFSGGSKSFVNNEFGIIIMSHVALGSCKQVEPVGKITFSAESNPMVTMWYALLCLLATYSAALDKRDCGICNPSLCPPLSACPVGAGLDPCHCCWECLKQSGDKCGGRWNLFGRCGYGMACKPARNSTLVELTELIGQCVQKSEKTVVNPCSSNPCPVQHQCWSRDKHFVCKHIEVTCGPKRAFSECRRSLDGIRHKVVNCSVGMSCLAQSDPCCYDQCYNKDSIRREGSQY
jgi:hypothetical protein